VNSEELEQSLRSEFENYLKGVRTEIQEQAAEFHKKLEAELDNHRTQVAEAFRAFSERFDSDQEFDEAFQSTVVEHLRLARDEGSKIAATAMVEAEELQQKTAPPADYSSLRDAINDISKQDSQSTILKSLITHSAQYAPRGAFFIIKSEHFVGWKVLGDDGEVSDEAVREIHFPIAADTILGESVRSMSTSEGAFGAHADDGTFLEPLNFGQPDRMYAIPLVARGRGVAVMYVDYGASGLNLNVDALETLVRIAGLTVELLAATHTAAIEARQTAPANFEDAGYEQPESVPHEAVPEQRPHFEEPAPYEATQDEGTEEPAPEYHAVEDETTSEVEEPAVQFGEKTAGYDAGEVEHVEEPVSDFAFTDAQAFDSDAQPFESTINEEPFSGSEEPEHVDFEATQPAFGETQTHDEVYHEPAPEYHAEPVDLGSYETEGATAFDSAETVEPVAEVSPVSPFETAAEFEPAVAAPVAPKPEASIEVSPSNTGYARLSDRPVDLPIQVPDDERRLHNDARRFARLLVSEIKLYNEKKVQEGRQARDLYERLREAIDRSREMYDKRVQPPVAAKFDYFHYELVNALADGEVERLGVGYPGSRI
jgi:hypothetical protein